MRPSQSANKSQYSPAAGLSMGDGKKDIVWTGMSYTDPINRIGAKHQLAGDDILTRYMADPDYDYVIYNMDFNWRRWVNA